MYHVLIVDDQRSSRELMKYVVSESPKYKLVGTLSDADESYAFCENNHVNLVLMDIHTAGKENGLKCAERIKIDFPCVKIIMVTFMVLHEHITIAQQVGCEGFWYKDHTATELIDVMDIAMSGKLFYPDELPVLNIGLAKTSEFTKQELAVLKLIVNGYGQLEICKSLNITRSTLNYHTANLKSKTGYDNLLKLAVDISSKKFIISSENFFDNKS